LTKTETAVLRELTQGSALKTHRELNGRKTCQLHRLTGPAITVDWATVARLKERGLIDSNKKFPVATYLLTEQGRRLAELLFNKPVRPLSAQNY